MKKYLMVIGLLLFFTPSWATDIDLDNNNAVDVAFGGTNASDSVSALTNLGAQPVSDNLTTLSSPTAWRLFISNATSAITEIPLGITGTVLTSTGVDTAPAFSLVGGSGGGTIGGSLGSTDNVIMRSDGTGGVTAQGSLVTLSDAGTVNIPTGQTYQIAGVAHTHNYQPADADLTTWAGITPSANMQAMALLTYPNMLTALGGQPVDADLTALAAISGVRGDMIYYGASGWTRIAKGTLAQVLTQGASDPLWADATGGTGGISNWDQIGDATVDATIALGGYKTIFTSTLDTGAIWTMTDTDASLSAATSFFDMKATSDGDANLFFMRGYDNAGGDLKWSIGQHGAFYGYSFETVQSATGGKLDLLEGSGTGTGYLRIKAPDAITGGTNTFTLSSSIANSEDFTIALGNNNNAVTLGSTTGGLITITPDTTITGDLTVTGADITLAAAGVKLTGSNGSLTILGLGDGQDEDVKIDLNSTANTITVSSPASSATAVSLSALNLVTTGTIQGGIKISSDADGMDAAAMTAAGMYGTLFIATGAGTWILPTAAVGMSACLMDSGTAHDLVLDATAGDTIRLKGTEGADGATITNATGTSTGDFVCVVAVAANKWSTMGLSGTWTVP